MTIAICRKCGEEKFGSFNPCPECGFFPRTDDDLAWSLAVSDRHFSKETLDEIATAVKAGDNPHLEPETMAKMLQAIRDPWLRKTLSLAGGEIHSQPDLKSEKGVLGRILGWMRNM
ncbi:MAG: hypothetical protein HY804_07000 [Nitrospinae bacterium]|nr:hypothetical protein [Nitrospinota bacterium]